MCGLVCVRVRKLYDCLKKFFKKRVFLSIAAELYDRYSSGLYFFKFLFQRISLPTLFDVTKMTEFKLVLETVQNGKSCINLFDKMDKNGVVKEELNDVDGFEVLERYTEYLLYLDAEQPLKERKVEKKAEIIVVVDKSGSMQGTPWKQVQSALIKMLGKIFWRAYS